MGNPWKRGRKVREDVISRYAEIINDVVASTNVKTRAQIIQEIASSVE